MMNKKMLSQLETFQPMLHDRLVNCHFVLVLETFSNASSVSPFSETRNAIPRKAMSEFAI